MTVLRGAMMAMQDEPPSQSGAARYTVESVRWLFEHYHYLRDHLGPRDEVRPGKSPKKRPSTDMEKTRALRRAEADRALSWLSQLSVDPLAADAIRGFYVDRKPLTRVMSEAQRERARYDAVHEVAVWQGVAERTVYERIERGLHRMARFLNREC